MATDPVVVHGAVVALNVGVLLRVSRLNIGYLDCIACCPVFELCTDVLRPIVAADGLLGDLSLVHATLLGFYESATELQVRGRSNIQTSRPLFKAKIVMPYV